MRNVIIQGDVLDGLKRIPDNYVQTVVTSPPYLGLRDYGVAGQIGLEETPEEYIEKLVQVFREVRRVLRSDGTCWINIGDSYAGGKTGRDDSGDNGKFGGPRIEPKERPIPAGYKPKDLMMIPARVALALQADGWWLRSDIIWHKPTAMPESVTDRPTTAHEHIFLLAKSERYFYDAEAIKEENSPTSAGNRKAFRGGGVYTNNQSFYNSNPTPVTAISGMAQEWTGRNKRNVWTIPTTPYSEAHFATFPPKLIEPCILAGSSPKACEHCGAPWERVTEAEPIPEHIKAEFERNRQRSKELHGRTDGHVGTHRPNFTRKIDTVGWQPTCTCTNNEGTGRCIVLDPFIGSGTTALVAIQHARHYLGIELNPEYVALAQKRIACVQVNIWESEVAV